MKTKGVALIILFLMISLTAIQAQKYPYAIFPGKATQVNPGSDTLWVLNNDQLQKTIGIAQELERVNKQATQDRKKADKQIKTLTKQLANSEKKTDQIDQATKTTQISSIDKDYPYSILPGQTIKVSSGVDTLWVLTDSQLRKAIGAARELEIANQQLDLYEQRIVLYDQKEAQTDSVRLALVKDRDFYKTSWEKSSTDIERLGVLLKKQKMYTRLSMAGIAVAFVLGLLIK